MELLLRNLVLSIFIFQALSAAPPEINTSTPKGTVKGVYDLAVAGDFDGMRKLFVTPANDQEKELFAEGFSEDMYIPALAAAVLEKFPGAKVPQPGPMIEGAKGQVDKMTENIEGDTATLTPPPPSGPGGQPPASSPFLQPIQFKKKDGAWKIAITENRLLRMPPATMRALHKARCEAMAGFIVDVKAGNHGSFDEFDKAMKQRLTEIQKQHMPAPSPPPGPAPRAPLILSQPAPQHSSSNKPATSSDKKGGAHPSDYEFVSLNIKTTRDETIKKDYVSVVAEFKNTIGKDLSALRGGLDIFDDAGTTVYLTGITDDNGDNLYLKASNPIKITLGYLDNAKITAGKFAGKLLLDAIRENPGVFKASLKVTNLRFTDKTEQN